MLNLKKTAVAVLAFGSSAVFAGTMGPVCTAGNVTVPCERNAWAFGVQALYLKPTYDSNIGSYSVTSSPSTVSIEQNDPDWNWGFKLEGAYHFSTGNDLNLNWYHLGGETETTRSAGTFTIPGVVVVGASDAFSLKPRWDAVNLEFGQHVDFGEFKNIRFHGGVQYARIKTELSHVGVASVTLPAPSGTTALAYRLGNSMTFNGFGPRIGADMSYDLGNGLAVYGNGATAILAGTSKGSTVVPALAAFALPTTFNASRTAVVPEVEAKLGLTYTYAMAQGDLSLDVGYMWVNYFKAQQSLATTDSDFGLHGPFAGLKWVGTVV